MFQLVVLKPRYRILQYVQTVLDPRIPISESPESILRVPYFNSGSAINSVDIRDNLCSIYSFIEFQIEVGNADCLNKLLYHKY